MPHVASDPVVQRPLRPEPHSSRAGAPAEASGSFETLLDKPAPTPGPEPRKGAGKNSAKSADTADAPAKNGLSSGTAQPVANAAEAAPENILVQVDLLAAVADAAAVEATGDAKPATTGATDAAVVKSHKAADGGSTDAIVAPETTAVDAAAVAIVAIVAPAPAPPPANALAIGPAADPAGIASVGLQASAPAAPPDAATPDVQAQPTTAPATADGVAPAKPQITSDAAIGGTADKTAPAEDTQKAAELKTAALPEIPEAKPAPADRKTESGKAKSDQRAGIAHATEPRSSPGTAARLAEAPADQPAKAPDAHPQPQAAEHASPTARAAVTDARSELPATAATPAQLNAATPNVPLILAAPTQTPLPSLWPVALRVDPADSAVPVAGLAVEIVSRAQDGLRRFEIRLDPPELGRIDVRLDVDSGGKVTSRLTVERAETLDLLRRDAPSLERALQHAGLNTEGGLQFSLRDQNFAHREQAPRDAVPTRLIIPDDEAVAAEAARRGYGRLIGLGGGVDIRV